MFVTRFAPSPTGPLHLGHAYSACLAHDLARAAGGHFLLRIEVIDQSRARPEWEAQLKDDLHWLGLDWPEPVLRQSERPPAYRAALDQLSDIGLPYPCYCRRADIEAAAGAPMAASIRRLPSKVYTTNLIAAARRRSPPQIPMSRYIGMSITSQKT